MRSSMVGTHVDRNSAYRRPTNRPGAQVSPQVKAGSPTANSVRFSDSRRGKKAVRGEVSHITPRTRSGESSREHARRKNQRGFGQRAQVETRRKRLGFLVCILIAAVCVGGLAGINVYFKTMTKHVALRDAETIHEIMAVPEENTPYYCLLSADLNSGDGSTEDADAILLIRVDPVNNTAIYMQIPGFTRATLSTGDYATLSQARVQDGDVAVVNFVSELTGIDIAHVAHIDADGITHLINSVGGLQMNVPEEIDDPNAGTIYLPAGDDQLLSAEQVMTMLRAGNVTGGMETQAANQAQVTTVLLAKLLDPDRKKLAFVTDEISDHITCDCDGKALYKMMGQLRDLSQSPTFASISDQGTQFIGSGIQSCLLPGYTYYSEDLGIYLYIPDTTDTAKIMKLINAGEVPDLSINAMDSITPSHYKVDVKNGSGTEGGADQLASILKKAGFKINSKGNAGNFVYDETLVVYKKAKNQMAAEAIVELLECGRAISSAGYYDFDGDLLVILGKEWKPMN